MSAKQINPYFKSFDDQMAANAEASIKRLDPARNYFNSFPRGWVKAHQMMCRNLMAEIAKYGHNEEQTVTMYNFIKKLNTDSENYVLDGALLINAVRILKLDMSVFQFDWVMPSSLSPNYDLMVEKYAKICAERPINERTSLWIKNPFEEEFLATARACVKANGHDLESSHGSMMRFRRIESRAITEITVYEYRAICCVLKIKESLHTPEYIIPAVLPGARPNGVNRRFYRKSPAPLSADSLSKEECAAVLRSLQEDPPVPVKTSNVLEERQDLLIRKSHYAGSVRLAGAMDGKNDKMFKLEEFAKIVDPFCEVVNIDSLNKMVSIMNCDFVNAINTNLDVSISSESKTVWVALRPVKFKIVRNDNKLVIDFNLPQEKLPELENKLNKFLIDNVA